MFPARILSVLAGAISVGVLRGRPRGPGVKRLELAGESEIQNSRFKRGELGGKCKAKSRFSPRVLSRASGYPVPGAVSFSNQLDAQITADSVCCAR